MGNAPKLAPAAVWICTEESPSEAAFLSARAAPCTGAAPIAQLLQAKQGWACLLLAWVVAEEKQGHSFPRTWDRFKAPA